MTWRVQLLLRISKKLIVNILLKQNNLVLMQSNFREKKIKENWS